MFAIFGSPNEFWFIERITFTSLTSLALLLYFSAYKRISAHKDQILKDTERWYLILSTIHLIFQFIYNCLIGSSFFLYFAYIILYIELLCINDTFTTHLEGFSANMKGYIETITKYGTLVMLIFGVVLVLQIESDNQCGQNLLSVNVSVYSVITIFTTAELAYIAWKKSQKLSKMSEDRSYNMDNELGEEMQMKQDGIRLMRQYKMFFIKLTYVVVFGYLLNTALNLYKLIPVAYENQQCDDVFSDKSAVFSVIFSIIEFFGLNLLNIFVYFEYYWSKRNEFSPANEQAILTDVYDNDRSDFIKGRVEMDDDEDEFGRHN